MEKKETRGGSRPGSGRPKKEATTTVAFRVRAEWKQIITDLVRVKVAELKQAEIAAKK